MAADKISLPPLPDYSRLAAALGPIAANQLCVTKWKDGIDIEVPCGDVDQMFRARDLEVVRVVLEAAAKHVRKQADDYDAEHGSTDPDTGAREYPGDGAAYIMEMEELADAILALEFTHHD